MNDELKHKIEAYLAGNLSSEETIAFETELQFNELLREEVRLSKEITHYLRGDVLDKTIPNNEYTEQLRSFFKSAEASDIKKKLREAKATYSVKGSKPKSKNSFWALAAMLIVLVGTMGYIFLSKDSSRDLYLSYYSSEDLPSVITRDDQNSDLQTGVLAFRDGDYDKALGYFNTYSEENENLNPAVYLYSGMAHLEQNAFDLAISDFDEMIDSETIDSSKGLWFKALAYLKNDDEVEAKRMLRLLIDDPSTYKNKEAQEILEQLD